MRQIQPRPPANDNLDAARLAEIQAALGERITRVVVDRGQVTLFVKPAECHAVLAALANDWGFAFFVDATAIDYSEWPESGEYPERFAVVYALLDLDRNQRIRVKIPVSELAPEIDTASDIWPGADWAEREIFDMYGLRFRGHPNLIRILCPENLKGHALRKDYPVTGRGERDEFPVYTTEKGSRS